MSKTLQIMNEIRLIELFSGIGSQAMALRDIGANFQHYKAIEFDKYAIKSYNSIHGTNFNTTDITTICGGDLEIVDTDKYTYILTYSFPCQDLSLAGKGKGMSKGSGTRSGLLWEVERLLNETKELPFILLMENVKQVIDKKNIDDFNKWCEFLESKGYKNYYDVLNAKDYGIPQNRERCFMVSILGDYDYEFPTRIPLETCFEDYLESIVDDKYYVNTDRAEYAINHLTDTDKINTRECRKDRSVRLFGLFDEDGKKHQAGSLWDKSCLSPTIDTMQGGYRQPLVLSHKFNENTSENDIAIRKITPRECWRLMDFNDDDINKVINLNSNTQLYKQSGNSIVKSVLMALFMQMNIQGIKSWNDIKLEK